MEMVSLKSTSWIDDLHVYDLHVYESHTNMSFVVPMRLVPLNLVLLNLVPMSLVRFLPAPDLVLAHSSLQIRSKPSRL